MTANPIIDVNVCLGRWPFQRFRNHTPGQLSAHLKKYGITGAWVSALESVLYPDPEEIDLELWKKLRKYPEMNFVKTVNPVLGNGLSCLGEWIRSRSLERVKVFPGFHQYRLADDVFTPLAERLTEAGIPLLVQMRLEDERAQYPMMRIPPVEVSDILKLNQRFPDLKIVVLCAYFREIDALAAGSSNLYTDISFAECLNTVQTLLSKMDAGRLLFGSHTPFLYTQSAVMKLMNSDIDPEQIREIAAANAEQLNSVK